MASKAPVAPFSGQNDAIAEPGVRNHGRLMERAVPWHRGFIHIAL